MNSGENYPPNQPIYQNHGHNNVIYPHVRIDPGTNNPEALIQGGYNPYPGQMNSRSGNNPVYNQYPQGPISGDTNNQPLINPRESVQFNRNRCSLIIFYFFTVIVEVILYIVVMADNTIWFHYCLYHFSLFKIQNFGSGFNNNFDQDISTFYNNNCRYDDSFENECPGFCDSISNLRNSGNYMLGFGIFSMICIGITGIFFVCKNCNPSAKTLRYPIYAFNILTLLLFFIGFIAYIASSKFSSNFKSPNAIYGFSWFEGFFLSIFLMVLMSFNFLVLFISLRKFYNR